MIRLGLAVASLLALFGAHELYAAYFDTESNAANSITTDTLDPPTGLTATDGSAISLSWTATPDTYATGYRILRSPTSGGPYSQIEQVTPRTSTNCVDAAASGTYYYVVQAFFQNWESVTSNEAVATASAGGGVTQLSCWVTGTTHVAESASDRALVVVVAREGGSLDLTAVSYGGQALTPAVEVETASGSTRARVEIWVLTEAGITAASDATIALTWAGSAGSNVLIDSAFFAGVDQATPIGATGSNAIIGDTPTTIATPALGTVAGDLVVYGVASGNAITYTPLNGFSEGNDQQVGSTATLATGSKEASGSSETPSADADSAPRRQVIAGLVLNFPVASAAVSGTITSAATEADIVAGGKTLVLTLSNETWDAAIGADNAQTTALIAGIDSAQAEASGWDAVVKANLTFNEVVRTSATVVTITLAAEASYDITANETITVTVPASAVAGSGAIVATPSVTVSTDVASIIYYVRTDGNDANLGTSNTSGGAWLTIQKAASTMVAGDTVFVQPGTYPETVTPLNGGSAALPLTYQGSGSVVIDGGNTRCYAFELISVDYVLIDGFEITDQPDCGGGAILLSGDSDFVTIRNNVIHDTGRDAILIGDTSDNALIENNLIYNIDDDGLTPSGGGSHIIRNNTIYNTGVTTGAGGYAIEGGQAANLHENNIFWASNIQNPGLGTFNYNDYNGGVLAGTGNISSDPLFVSAAGADFHLSHVAAGQASNSPAIDVGSTTAAALGLDTRSTRSDSVDDSGTVDLGYHYP